MSEPYNPIESVTIALSEFGTEFGPWLSPGAILISGLVAAIVAIVAIWQQRAIARKRAMIEALLRKNWDRDYIKIRKEFVRIRDDRAALLEAAKEENQSGDDASAIRSILNDYEITALGIKRGILDEAIFKLWCKNTFLTDCEKTRPFIEEIKLRHRQAFVESQELARKWKPNNN